MEGQLASAIQANARLEARVINLEDRLDVLEMANRRSNLILSGDAVANISPSDNLNNVIAPLLRSTIQYELQETELISVIRLGVKPSVPSLDKRSILVKLQNEDTKRDILVACRRVRPRGLYANEDLTPHRASLLFALRRAKKSSKDNWVWLFEWEGLLISETSQPGGQAAASIC